MSASDEVARLEVCLAAVRAAADVCAAHGAPTALRDGRPVMEVAVELFEGALADARRRALPLAIGGEVLVRDSYSDRGGPKSLRVVRVGRELVHLSNGCAYELASGHIRGIGSDTIDAPDLDRVRRDLAPKARPSGR